jgi:glycosyltransferase involved in cell wall biosynthesis
MPARALHIAWLGPAPGADGGVPEVGTELLHGLAALGHRIDCFFPSSGQELPARVADDANIAFVWGTSRWRWDRWYSRTRIMAFASGILWRSVASVRLRAQIERRHREDPYDVVYQFSSVESLAVPPRLTRTVPLVIHPETHSAGELRSLLAERALSVRCQGRVRFALVAAIMLLRSRTQRKRIRAARLLVCISGVFRDHLVRDYGFPLADTVVVANPVRMERFTALQRPPAQPPVVLVLGRVVARKGIETVVAVAKRLHERGETARIRVVGGPSLWSDYTRLLEELPAQNAEYAGPVDPSRVPAELAASDVLLQASRYEPFALTVAEALASGLPVIGTSEVGAIEGVARSVVAEVQPGDADAMADAILAMLARLRADPAGVRANARAEAQRLFAPEVVCEQISRSLERLVDGAGRDGELGVGDRARATGAGG